MNAFRRIIAYVRVWTPRGLLWLAPLVALTGGARETVAATPPAMEVPSPVAATMADTVWTLETALARAMEANADVVAARHEVERQEGIRIQVRARLLPTVTASAGANEREHSLVDAPPSQRFLPPSPDTAVALYTYDMRVEIRQVVFDGFSSWHQMRRQDLISKQAFLALNNAALRTATLVRQAFDAVQMRRELLAAEQRRVEESGQIVRLTQAKHAVGDLPEFELLRAQSELEGTRAELAEAGRTLGQAEQNFRRLLQISDFGSPLRLAGKFEARSFTLPLDEAVAQARLNRPDLQSALVGVDAAKRNERSQVGRNLPRVEAFASYGRRSSYYNSAFELDGWTYGVMGQWSLFEGGAGRGAKMTLRAETRAAEDKLLDTEHQVVSKLRELYESLNQARAAMDAQQQSMNLSSRASRDAQRLFEVGQASLEQVLQTGMSFRRAESRYGEAVFNYNSIIAEIEYSVGGRLSDSVNAPVPWKP